MKKHLKKLFKISPHNVSLLKSIIIIIIFVLFSAFLFWWTNPNRVSTPVNSNNSVQNDSSNNPANITAEGQSQELLKEANALLGQSTLSFPNIKGLSREVLDKTPAKIKTFILSNVSQTDFAIINYTDGSHGYYLSYFVTNSKIADVQSELYNILNNPKSGWIYINSLRAEIFALSDYENSASQDSARATFIQNGNDVRVILQTHTGKV